VKTATQTLTASNRYLFLQISGIAEVQSQRFANRVACDEYWYQDSHVSVVLKVVPLQNSAHQVHAVYQHQETRRSHLVNVNRCHEEEEYDRYDYVKVQRHLQREAGRGGDGTGRFHPLQPFVDTLTKPAQTQAYLQGKENDNEKMTTYTHTTHSVQRQNQNTKVFFENTCTHRRNQNT
jgi:hypothetical protein